MLAGMICGTVIVVAYLASRVAAEYYRSKAAKSRQMAAVRRGTASKAAETPITRGELGEWVYELINRLGHDESELYEDEMPDDLSKLLNHPLAKGLLAGVANQAGGAEGAGSEGGEFLGY